MARYKKLAQSDLLQAAEQVVCEEGAHALSIGSVAKAAGVSRGGVQSCFGTKEQLVEALFQSWTAQFEECLRTCRTSAPSDADPIHTFVQASRMLHTTQPERNAAMMILMTQSQERRQWARDWILGSIGGVDTSTEQGRRRRLHFLLWESLLAVKSMQIMEFSDGDWLEIFDDLDRLLA
ncbi:MAG: TetR/AcrR family transcriptional regulator [Pseudomonadales bacterium]